MKTKSYYRYAAIVLILVLAFAFISSSAEGEEIYFTGINDNLNKLDASTMPYFDKDQYYVPYKIFDDLSLGVYYTYNKDNYTLTLFNRNNTLIFQLLLGYSYDNNQQFRERAVSKNNTLYIPIGFVCERFGLELQVINTPMPVIRVVSDALLNQNEFKDKYLNRIVTEGTEYQDSIKDSSPSPSIPGQPGVSPTPSDEPKIIPEVYLTFDCYLSFGFEDGQRSGLVKLLDTLSEHNVTATFFLTEDIIESERDSVLRIIGSGHSAGILVMESEGENSEATGSQYIIDYVNRSNRLLDSYTHTKTRICRIHPDSSIADDQEARAAIGDAGFVVWDWTMNADAFYDNTSWRTASQWTSEIYDFAQNSSSVIFRAGLTDVLYEPVSELLDFLYGEYTIFHLITPAKDPDKINQ